MNREAAAAQHAAQVGWTSEWYLRHDTLEQAAGAIVDHQGGGEWDGAIFAAFALGDA